MATPETPEQIEERIRAFASAHNQRGVAEAETKEIAKRQAVQQVAAEARRKSIQDALEKAKPSWQTDGKGLRGDAPRNTFDHLRMRTTQPHMPTRQDLELFPALTPPVVAQTTVSGGGGGTPLPFELTIVSAADLQIKVQDGTVNNDFPSGMGFDSYVLTIAEESYTGIYIYVTYDEDTLDITSLSLTSSDTTLESEPGTLVIFIGWIDLTYDVDSNIVLTPHNTQVGNILFEFIYGAHNGLPALLPVSVVATWIELPDIDPP